MSISPNFLMGLIQKISDTLYSKYKSYKNVQNYIDLFLTNNNDKIQQSPYFYLTYINEKFDLTETLSKIAKDENELILKIAADLGLEIPGFIPSIPLLKRKLDVDFVIAKKQLEETVKDVYENPDKSVHLANTTLETIVKHILDDTNPDYNPDNTLKRLIEQILQEFKLRDENLPNEFKGLCSGLINSAKNIESLRSDKSVGHGSARKDYIISSPIYASFVVNSIASIGLFLIEYYENKYKKEELTALNDFDPDEIDPDEIQMPF